eukprot:GHVT01097950.1.p1 GENE.GHVT01097950.1~~GHVT01097950.1.p1  ORF type:complete len:101 (+),score=14.97 GHVT01097950.1:28-303(+)
MINAEERQGTLVSSDDEYETRRAKGDRKRSRVRPSTGSAERMLGSVESISSTICAQLQAAQTASEKQQKDRYDLMQRFLSVMERQLNPTQQ